MKHLLTGVAMAAALAIAAPAWAQNAPMTPSAPPKAAAPAPKAAAPKPASTTTMAKKPMRHHHMARRMGSGDQMTEQLNQQELQRITSGAPPAPMPMASPTPGGNNPTSGTAGPFAPAGSAPPPPAK